MGEADQLREFAAELSVEVRQRLAVEATGTAGDMFVRLVAERLIEDGAIEDLDVCYLRTQVGQRRIEVSGYEIGEGGAVLYLATRLCGADGERVPKESIDRLIRNASNFAIACQEGVHARLEESGPAFDMAQRIHASWEGIKEIRIFVLTDGRSTIQRLESATVAGLPTTYHLWDIVRLHRIVTSGRRHEEIVIDLDEMGAVVPCLPSPEQSAGYRCLLAVVPGKLLANLYDEHHDRLLQRNVRAYLQNRPKVNREIHATISKTPGSFLAYNNGISATATEVKLTAQADGTPRISRLRDLQIVNGGQTTASLHHAARAGHDLSEVHVMAKITIVPADLLDQLVPAISRYANSQNAIRPADFEANGPFHVALEQLSRSVWAPATDGSTRPTRWYYERARGQYQVERSRLDTQAKRRAFDRANPSRQRFTKTDAAKFEMAHALRPHVVSLGAEKCFLRWTENHNADGVEPDKGYFEHMVAKGILFAGVREAIKGMKLGGYLAQTAAYTTALLVQRLGARLDLDVLWRLQRVPGDLLDLAPEAGLVVRDVLVDAPGSANVTEWCKKLECWQTVERVSWSPGS